MIQFEEMGLTPGVLKAVHDLGFVSPTPVQEKIIPMITGGDSDIIALAQTGTGKTAAFGLPLVMMTDSELNYPQALILCPTRELCRQITDDLTDFSKYTGSLKTLAVYGGASIETQIRALKHGVQILVATPGRLMDLIRRRAVKLSAVSTVVLDEADEMLNMGFLDSINEILEEVPPGRRTLLFSATMSPDIASIAGKYMNNPEEITIGAKNASAENVSHGYYLVHAKDKYKVLKRIADFEPGIYGIIFCRTRRETQEIASRLMDDGYNADALHGDLSQSQRDTVMQKFRTGNIRLLVATDVAARGLDVDDLTHVINFSLPDDLEVYTHRCGRTGRAGKTGISISIIHLKEKHNLHRIEKLLRKSFNPIPVPTGSEICGKQLFNWVEKLEKVPDVHVEIERFLPEIKEKLATLDREELLRRVVSLEFDRFLDDYRSGDAPIETFTENEGRPGRAERKPKERQENVSYRRIFINLGKADGFSPEQLIGVVNRTTRGKKIMLGKIEILNSFSFFEADEKQADNIIEQLCNATYRDRKVVAEVAQEKTDGERRFRSKEKRKPDQRQKKREAQKSKWQGKRSRR